MTHDEKAILDGFARPNRPWAKWVLLTAAAYNLIWGAWVILFPLSAFEIAEMTAPTYPEIWQCVGMIVGVYGVGYAIAAADPVRYWPIILVGMLGKLLGPIGFLKSALGGSLSWSWGWIIVFNDLIWWVPFGFILWGVWCGTTRMGRASDAESITNVG